MDTEGEEDPIYEAERLIEKGNYPEALNILGNLSLPEAYILRSKAYLEMGKSEEAIRELKEGINRFPYAHYMYYELALLYFTYNDLVNALDEVNNALSILPYSYDYNKLKARILFEMQEYEEAFEVLTYVIKMKPDDVESRLLRAQCFYLTGKFLDALKEINRALEYNNKDETLHTLKGKIYLETHFYKLALSEFKISVSIRPTAENYYLLAFSEYMTGECEKAVSDSEKALSLDPNNDVIREFYESLRNMCGQK
ncbi:hypothetical protein SUSAZ_09585 [Sulfolobus acidocaldarius SUSAZ]|nr:hypothetical protein SUSAZ_09585 [Sulfolobus acidocaldarius SUSAZ]